MTEVKAYLYDFSGNYDCTSCGRVNCSHAVVVQTSYGPYLEYCSRCIWELALDAELEEYIRARERAMADFPPHD